MYPLKNWLTKKLLFLISFFKWIKKEWIVSRHFIKKMIAKHQLLLSIKKTFFVFSIRLKNFLIDKGSFFYESLYKKSKPVLYKILNSIRSNKVIQLIIQSSVLNKVFNQTNKIPIVNKIPSNLQKKFLIFFPLALGSSLLIFYFMSFLISAGKKPIQANSQNVNINFLLNSKLDELELRSRRLPKKPKKEESPPKTPQLKIQQTERQKPKMVTQLPQLDLPDDFQSDKKGAGVSAHGHQDREVTPIFRIQPIYPRRAALRNIEGFVILQFDITPAGYTDNITVIQASPPQIFNSSATQALRKWKYKPKLKNGKPIRQNKLKVQLDFKLKD